MRPITFLTDFGHADEYAGVCRLVIAGVDPSIPVVDLTHGIPAGDVRRGALALAATVPNSPPAVHLAVVDPGVGTDRRAVVLSCGEHHLVGPDNGLLMPAAEVLGGVDSAHEIPPPEGRVVSDTFHGRDLFSPAAAALACGGAADEIGPKLDRRELASLNLPEPEFTEGGLVGHVLFVDRYGNAALDIREPDLARVIPKDPGTLLVELGGRRMAIRLARTFGDVAVGKPALLFDSSGHLALVLNRASAADRFGIHPDDEIGIAPIASGE